MPERFEVLRSYGVKATLLERFLAARASQSPEDSCTAAPGHESAPSSSSADERAFEDICSSALPISLDELRCRYFSAVHTLALPKRTASAESTAARAMLFSTQAKQSVSGDL